MRTNRGSMKWNKLRRRGISQRAIKEDVDKMVEVGIATVNDFQSWISTSSGYRADFRSRAAPRLTELRKRYSDLERSLTTRSTCFDDETRAMRAERASIENEIDNLYNTIMSTCFQYTREANEYGAKAQAESAKIISYIQERGQMGQREDQLSQTACRLYAKFYEEIVRLYNEPFVVAAPLGNMRYENPKLGSSIGESIRSFGVEMQRIQSDILTDFQLQTLNNYTNVLREIFRTLGEEYNGWKAIENETDSLMKSCIAPARVPAEELRPTPSSSSRPLPQLPPQPLSQLPPRPLSQLPPRRVIPRGRYEEPETERDTRPVSPPNRDIRRVPSQRNVPQESEPEEEEVESPPTPPVRSKRGGRR